MIYYVSGIRLVLEDMIVTLYWYSRSLQSGGDIKPMYESPKYKVKWCVYPELQKYTSLPDCGFPRAEFRVLWGASFQGNSLVVEKGLSLSGTGNVTQYSVMTCKGIEPKKERMYVYV